MNKHTIRLDALLPNGEPRYVRCYYKEDCADGYTILFTKKRNSSGEFVYLGCSANPFHPQGVGMYGFSTNLLDDNGYKHLGKKIKFEALPDDVKRLVIEDYIDLWDLDKSFGRHFASDVDSKYGAPMGRYSNPTDNGKYDRTVKLPLLRGDEAYDVGGAYWGLGDYGEYVHVQFTFDLKYWEYFRH